jgi:electron transfer flavoprotein alpha subunit
LSVQVISTTCTGCETCVSACPFGAIEMRNGKAFITESCTLCGACIEACEFKAIERTGEEAVAAAKDLSAFKGVWVFLTAQGGSQSVALVLREGRKLADKRQEALSRIHQRHQRKAKTLSPRADVVYAAMIRRSRF